MNIVIEHMNITCIDEILELSALSFNISWSKNSFLNELDNTFAKYLVAKDKDNNNKVIGFAGVWLIIDEGHITNIAVHPDYRGNGIGDLLMRSLIKLCNENKALALTLEVRASNIVAQNLYKKYGFVKEGIRKKYYEDNGEDAVLMWKR